jgi:Domain of unknown function (DUF4332)
MRAGSRFRRAPRRYPLPVIALGLAALAASTAGLFLLFEPVLAWYYQLAWWSYIVFADGMNRRLAGRSLIRDRRREFLWLAGLSVAWWCVFELINLRLGNWYYVMSHPVQVARWAAGVLGFATVLPGIVATLELVENLGIVRRSPAPRLAWTRRKEGACLALGALFFALPLLWPDSFFHLTWGSFALLLEPWNRRHARASFLRDLEAGDAAPLVRTLAAGLACGLLWELWNYWARSKWIYTVPGFEDWKLFEMPLLGFLGFPPFAVESLVAMRFVQGWADRLKARGPRTGRLAAAAFAGTAAAFTAGVFACSDATVDSLYVPVARMESLPPPARERLAALGLESQEKLLRALGDESSRAEWSRHSGLGTAELEAARDRVALVVHKGLGDRRAVQLQALGVQRRQDLRRWTAASLAAALRAQGPGYRFLDRRVRVWLRGLPE